MLIITEKPDAARKIGYILSGGKSVTRKAGKVSWLEFTWKGQQVYCVGLRGHIVGIDFPPQFKSWVISDLNAMINADPVTKSTVRDVVSVLRDLAKKVSTVIVATDFDMEGELIGVEALDIVKKSKKPGSIQRARYSSFTAPEINSSFSSLAAVDYDLADAANSRQVIDLLWGAVLTRFMTLTNGNDGVLSVGRVQTPTLAKIVERELEIRAFVPEPYWQITAMCKGQLWGSTKRIGDDFKCIHEQVNFKDESDAKRVYAKVKGATLSTIIDHEKRSKRERPPAPFDTTQFTKAATQLGLTAEQAMNTAESLYMKGIISYPRTDNTVYPATLDLRNLVVMLTGSTDHGSEARMVNAQTTLKPTRGKKATVDHPPIYPVANASKSSLTDNEWKVYDLVVRRFLATLYIDYEYDTTSIKLDIESEVFRASGAVVIEEGWRGIYRFGWHVPDPLPKLKKGDVLPVLSVDMEKKMTQPPNRYSQGGLIGMMEKLGIGTKSTRHNILKTLQRRDYISGGRSIQATELGIQVVGALQSHATKVTTPDMTSELEKEMEQVADGKKTSTIVIDHSRDMLRSILVELRKHTMAIKKLISKGESLGSCPKCGEDLEVRKGKKRGSKRFVGCSAWPKCNQTYPLPQRGKIVPDNRACSKCGSPVVKVIGGGKKPSKGKSKPWIICVNMGCGGP